MCILDKEKDYRGEMIHQWKDIHQNMYVITGLQAGNKTIDNKIGRVAQVRLEAGDFGSDNVLLRHVDNTLCQHTNQSFWLVKDEYIEYLNEKFKDCDLDDSDKEEYTLGGGKAPEKGFIIKSKIKEGESTPMRDIKNSIMDKIEKRL